MAAPVIWTVPGDSAAPRARAEQHEACDESLHRDRIVTLCGSSTTLRGKAFSRLSSHPGNIVTQHGAGDHEVSQ